MVTSIGATAKRSKELKKAASCRSRNPPRCPLGARSMLPPVSPTRRLLYARLAQHRIPPHSMEQRLHVLGNLKQSRVLRARTGSPLARGSIECTSGQAGSVPATSLTVKPDGGLKRSKRCQRELVTS